MEIGKSIVKLGGIRNVYIVFSIVNVLCFREIHIICIQGSLGHHKDFCWSDYFAIDFDRSCSGWIYVYRIAGTGDHRAYFFDQSVKKLALNS